MSDHHIRERVEKLREAADVSARNARNNFLMFLLAGLYIAIIIGSTTDEQLLRESGVTLPILNVDLPIVGVYMFAPPLFVLLHFNMLLQLKFLSRNLHQLDRGIALLRAGAERARQRDLIFPFTFSHLIVGRHRGVGMRGLIRLMAWITLIILPVLLLLWAQIAFLPYHSVPITWGAHRLMIVADLAMLWFFWPRLLDPQGEWRPWRGTNAMNAIVAKFRASVGSIGSLMTLWLSLFVFSVPDEAIEFQTMRPVIALVFGDDGYGKALGRGHWYERWFHRNLVLLEKTLVAEAPAPEIVAAYLDDDKTAEEAFSDFGKGLDLSGRDLRYAVLSEANLTKADLRNAYLERAMLWNTNLRWADLGGARLEGAFLSDANLQDADLSNTQLRGAVLSRAKLQGANLSAADMRGADLGSAKLQGASLVSNADLRGVNLAYAVLQGADLTSAQLQGADLSYTDLQGADLQDARLQGANLSESNLQAANLGTAFLGGTDFAGASFRLVNLLGSNLDLLSSREWGLLYTEVEHDFPDFNTALPDLLVNLGERARERLKQAASRSYTVFPKYETVWGAVYGVRPELDSDFQRWPLSHWPPSHPTDERRRAVFLFGLSSVLASLACKDRYVARGIVAQILGFSRLRSSNLARFLLYQKREMEVCPGLAALSGDILRDIEVRAEENF